MTSNYSSYDFNWNSIPIIGNVIGGLWDMIMGGKSMDLAQDQLAYQMYIDRLNYDLQKSMFEQNFGLQQEVFDYQKNLQQELFGREDTAVQRRVADLKAAGINPILAAGSAANAGQAVMVNTPQRQVPQHGKSDPAAMLNARHHFQTQMLQRMSMANQIHITEQQRKLIQAQEAETYARKDEHKAREQQILWETNEDKYNWEIAQGLRTGTRTDITTGWITQLQQLLDYISKMAKEGKGADLIRNSLDVGRDALKEMGNQALQNLPGVQQSVQAVKNTMDAIERNAPVSEIIDKAVDILPPVRRFKEFMKNRRGGTK